MTTLSTATAPPFRANRLLQGLVCALGLWAVYAGLRSEVTFDFWLENILTGLHAGVSERGKGGRRASDAERASAIAGVLGLGDDLYCMTEGLTFRQQRYVEIARALVSEPRLVMLDEPAAGLSGPEIQELGDRLIDLQSRYGFAVLLVEHVIPLVTRVCPYVTVLENGRVLASGPGPEVMAHPDVVRAYLGEGVHA